MIMIIGSSRSYNRSSDDNIASVESDSRGGSRGGGGGGGLWGLKPPPLTFRLLILDQYVEDYNEILS